MFDWTTLLLQVANGLTFGGLLFILASGFTLIFGLMRIVNMAHGAFYILGAYLAYSVTRNLNSWAMGVVSATAGVGLLALASYTIVRRVKGDLPQTLLTLGIGTVVADLTLAVWGGNPKSISAPAAIGRPLTIEAFTYPGYRYFVLSIAILISLAQMSFAAAAGYIIAIGAVKLGISQWVLFPSAIVGATALSAIFGLVAIRGQKIYFLMMTLALGQLFYGIGMQWVSLTGGAYGYTGLARPTILGYSLLEATPLYYVTLAITVLSYLALRRVVHSNFGLVLQGIRDNPKRMAALGFNVQLHRYFAIVISGAFAGVAGILNTYFTGVITPSRAGLSQSVIVVMAALVGGVRRLEGGLLGGILIAFLLSVTNELTPRYWTVVGALFILAVMFLPNGLLGGALPQLRSIRRWGQQIGPGKRILRSGASPVAGSRQFKSKTSEHAKDDE